MKLFDEYDCDCYTPSFFAIYMNNSLSLKDMIGSNYEHRLFHEYIHFLEDVTTTFGIGNANTVLEKILDVSLYIRNYKNSSAFVSIPLDKSCHHNVINSTNPEFFKYYLQYVPKTEKIANLNSLKIKKEEIETFNQLIHKPITIPIYKINFNNGYTCYFGAHSIQEGIAHQLEKHVYKINPDEYQNPYDISYLIWKNYLPEHKNNLEALIDLSEFSLMFFNSADIFINIIHEIKNGNIKIDKQFYNKLLSLYKCNYDKKRYTVNELFIQIYDSYITNVKEIFKSDIYIEYKNWLLNILEKAKQERLESKPIFSSLLELRNYSKKEKSNWMRKVFYDFGFPPIINADDEIYCINAKDNPVSFIVALAMNSAYDCLHKPTFNGCKLKESCIYFQNHGQLFDLDDTCDTTPWKKKVNKDSACPFAAVWKTWGLDNVSFEWRLSN